MFLYISKFINKHFWEHSYDYSHSSFNRFQFKLNALNPSRVLLFVIEMSFLLRAWKEYIDLSLFRIPYILLTMTKGNHPRSWLKMANLKMPRVYTVYYRLVQAKHKLTDEMNKNFQSANACILRTKNSSCRSG